MCTWTTCARGVCALCQLMESRHVVCGRGAHAGKTVLLASSILLPFSPRSSSGQLGHRAPWQSLHVFMNTQSFIPSVARAGLRLQRLAATLTVDSLHTRPYRQAAARAEAKQTYGKMAGHHGTVGSEALTFGPARLAYTIVYVRDVPKAVEFYQKAFGVGVRRVDDSRRWAELETGSTTLAFTPLEQREAAITGGIHAPVEGEQRSNVELCFTFKDVDAAFKHAVETGAQPVAPPEPKEWGQKVGYVRDPDGVTIRLGSEI